MVKSISSDRNPFFFLQPREMVQHSSLHASRVDDQETTGRLDLDDSAVKEGVLESFCSLTLLSYISSEEYHAVHSKCSKQTRRIRNIILSVIFGFFILSLGIWSGWVIGERRKASNLPLVETGSFGTSTDSPSITASPNSMQVNNGLVEPPFEPMSVTDSPSKSLTGSPVTLPVKSPVTPPSKAPIDPPSKAPIDPRSKAPINPFVDIIPVPEEPPPVAVEITLTYIPGNLTRFQNNLLLSEGLEARIIAQSGKRLKYADGSSSDVNFHILPDGGAAFPDTRWWNSGGWIYVSNSEAKNENEGGVGAITFDKYGSVLHYRMVLENTYMNCGGGRTPWNTWVSCEEIEFTGQIYQVDPTGQRPAQQMTIGSAGGRWESFAYDIRDKDKPRFFSTEDHNKGCTRRFTPSRVHWGGDEWKMLHEAGVMHYLFINLNRQRTGGTFEWTNDLKAAKNNARTFYPQSEGIDIQDGKMYIVSKKIQQLFIFDLDQMTFRNVSTVSGLFDGDPDQLQRILGSKGGLLYFTEEGGVDAGVHA